jgi:ubiquinone/menaquinone biosynthesis C-methylase UbiE
MIRSEKFWDLISNSYAKQDISDEKAYNLKKEKINSELKKDDSVFDYGCGTGSLSIEISSKVKEIHAIDISSKMLGIARERIDKEGIRNITLKKSDLDDVDFLPGSYDVVIAVNIFHFIDDIGKDLSRIYEMLKPGGLLISETPCMGEDKKLANKAMYYLGRLGVIPKLNMLTFNSFEELISEGGFSITYKMNLSETPRDYLVFAKKM